MKKIRVLIVEDSDVVSLLLKHIISDDPRLEVAGSCSTAEEALQLLDRMSPDIITMDVRLPGMNGFEATRRIMAERPTPIVVVSAASDELNVTMNALQAGALSVVDKPVGLTHEAYRSVAEQLCTQLAIMSEVKLVRQRAPRVATPRKRTVNGCPPAGDIRMIGVVASTGGPNALVTLLSGLDRSFPIPILLVQHITGTFHDGFVAWLGSQCELEVVVARDRESARGGRLYVAPPGRHLTVEGAAGYLRLTDGPPVARERPSGTVLFESMASALGARALGILLTGMGADGAVGMRALYDAGAWTVAEDATTAVVYGMPAEAVRLGAVRESLPLHEIGLRMRQLVTP